MKLFFKSSVLLNVKYCFFLKSDSCGRGLKPLWRAVLKRRGSVERIHSLSGFNCVDGKKSEKKILYAVSKISRCEWKGPESNITRPAVLGKKRFTPAKKVYNCWTLTLIGHPYSSARIQTKPYQLKGWIRTKRA